MINLYKTLDRAETHYFVYIRGILSKWGIPSWQKGSHRNVH